ncbi:acyl-CoA dehydrogenase family protein [Azospirillum sp. sgz302134]
MKPWPLWDTPFFEDRHRAFAERLLTLDLPEEDAADLAGSSRRIARAMGDCGLLDIVVPPGAERGDARIDLRSVCLAREILAYRFGDVADSAFVMQGIGTAALWQTGSATLCDRYLPPARRGEAIAAFALTEPDTGSDVANLTTSAVRDGDGFRISGEKTFISNAGIADHYIVVARTGEAPGARGLTAFLLDAGMPGLTAGPAIDFMAPHPAAPLTLDRVRVGADRIVGAPGQGFKVAMATFDVFRASVGAAGIGAARRALDESLARVTGRRMFGKAMAEIEGVQTKLADMATTLETAALCVYRAAWTKDVTGGRCTRDVSMAKLVGSEAAHAVVDAAVQLFGGLGVTRGCVVEKLYREVRPMRIYEGASEVQKLVIARDLLKSCQ